MADIEVVIKIDEDIYNRFTHNEVRPRFEITEEERFQMDADAVRLTRAFCNGTPLPKGHGRLIDADALNIPVDICDGFEAMDYIDEAETIIEADKNVGEENGKMEKEKPYIIETITTQEKKI